MVDKDDNLTVERPRLSEVYGLGHAEIAERAQKARTENYEGTFNGAVNLDPEARVSRILEAAQDEWKLHNMPL